MVDESLLLNQTIVISTLDELQFPTLDDDSFRRGRDGGYRKTFKCDRCDRSYYHSQSLQRHRSLECGKVPQMSCPHCPYRCKQKTDLKKHMNRRHRGLASGEIATAAQASNHSATTTA